MMAMRTNSPIKGYHARLKRLAKRPHLNLYLLLELLWVESNCVSLTCFLLANYKLGNYQKKNSASFTFNLFGLWENFNSGLYDTIDSFHADLTYLVAQLHFQIQQ